MTQVEITEDVVKAAVSQALSAAHTAASEWVRTNPHGLCGFAWVMTNTRGNSRVVRLLKMHGFKKAYGGGYCLWNPSGLMTQSVDALEVGAQAAAQVLTEQLGVVFYAQSKLD